MSVQVDSSRCQGHGRCYELSPDVFEADDQGMAVVRAGTRTPERSAAAELAAANCPESAIVLDAGSGNR